MDGTSYEHGKDAIKKGKPKLFYLIDLSVKKTTSRYVENICSWINQCAIGWKIEISIRHIQWFDWIFFEKCVGFMFCINVAFIQLTENVFLISM